MNRTGRSVIAGIAALLLAGACTCSGSHATKPGVGGGSSDGSAVRLCDDIRAKVERLYRAEATAKEPKRVEEAVADNTTMVLNDCAKAPSKVAACVNEVSSIAELEKKCLAPLDDEGTEGEELRR
jgi:hypothetical protein